MLLMIVFCTKIDGPFVQTLHTSKGQSKIPGRTGRLEGVGKGHSLKWFVARGWRRVCISFCQPKSHFKACSNQPSPNTYILSSCAPSLGRQIEIEIVLKLEICRMKSEIMQNLAFEQNRFEYS